MTPQIKGNTGIYFKEMDILRYIPLWLPVGDENYALVLSFMNSILDKPIFYFWVTAWNVIDLFQLYDYHGKYYSHYIGRQEILPEVSLFF